MPNRLIHANSPYLLQHANNPVDWYPWGGEALVKAKTEDKPIFLSVGYAACHWCHVMEHESFEDEATAAIMNEHFVNIKVDREERPDIDHIYMQAVVAMTRQGGWPMSVFLTPEGQPFYGGTYFPPKRRYNMPAFQEILHTIAHLWQNDRQQLLASAKDITQHIQSTITSTLSSKSELVPEVIQTATAKLAEAYDWENGGWGQAPKFPQPMIIEFLLQRAISGDPSALKISIHALKAMAKGGMYDVVGGGFARYSVDNLWLVPHFEKMLYDNAQLARVYLHAYLVTKDEYFQRVSEATLDFVLREMTHPAGGFYSSLDADSEGEEGKFYTWNWDEIQDLDFDHQDKALMIAAYGISDSGNFEGANVLQRVLSDKEIASKFNLRPEDVPVKLDKLHARLLNIRSERIRPGTDDKVLTSWNALMLIAFAEAGRYLKRPDYTRVAMRNADFILTELIDGKKLQRAWRNGKSGLQAYLEDYAALILGLLSLYQSDPDNRWYNSAIELAEKMIANFRDPAGGLFDTADDHEELLLRPKDTQDNATPSGNALAALALLQLSAYSGNSTWRNLAETMLEDMGKMMALYPTSFAQWLCALNFYLASTQEVAILGDQNSEEFKALVEILWEKHRPYLVAAISNFPPFPNGPELLANRGLINQQPSAYVCRNFACQYPVTTSEDFRNLLEA